VVSVSRWLPNVAFCSGQCCQGHVLISAWLIFWIAFRDGSPPQDYLAFYTGLAQHHLTVKRGYEQRVKRDRAADRNNSDSSTPSVGGRFSRCTSHDVLLLEVVVAARQVVGHGPRFRRTVLSRSSSCRRESPVPIR
jgi:hypothetical protein